MKNRLIATPISSTGEVPKPDQNRFASRLDKLRSRTNGPYASVDTASDSGLGVPDFQRWLRAERKPFRVKVTT